MKISLKTGPLLGLLIFSSAGFAHMAETTLTATPAVLNFTGHPTASNMPDREDTTGKKRTAEKYFGLSVQPGEKLGNIFSRTISFRGKGFDEYVSRISGTSVYNVIDNDPDNPVFDELARLDGRPEVRLSVKFTDQRSKVSYNNGNLAVNTEGSGLLFNPLLWGAPPINLKKGTA